MPRFAPTVLVVLLVACATGCQSSSLYVPERAMPPYPAERHTMMEPGPDGDVRRVRTANIQVFPSGTEIDVVNPTSQRFENVTVWVNQRHALEVAEIPAAATTTLPLPEFFDEWGQRFLSGGFWRTTDPMPVLIVEIETSPDAPLLGLVTVPPDVDPG